MLTASHDGTARIWDAQTGRHTHTLEYVVDRDRDEQFHNATGSIELPTLFAFGEREFSQEVFEYMPKHIGAALFGITKRNIAHQINKPAQVGGVQIATGKDLWQVL